jgi:2-oxoglutarate ferredoxin oxidoreductase subunit gamma
MLVKTIFAGNGGQGVLTIGNILGNAAMNEDYHVTYLPAYGAAMRGGTANCTICISDEEIASPVASEPDYVVALNPPSASAFGNRLEPGGQLIYNSSIKGKMPIRGDISFYPVPAIEVARAAGSERSVNVVMLGAFLKLTGLVRLDTIYGSIEHMLGEKKKLIELTKTAVTMGYEGFPYSGIES